MSQNNNIKNLGSYANINFNTLKGGLKKSDLKNNEHLIQLFNKFDADKNGLLTQNEISAFCQSLQPYTENEYLSKREVRKYSKEYGLTNMSRQEILEFIDNIEKATENVVKTYNTKFENENVYAIQYKANERNEIITEFYDVISGNLKARTTKDNESQITMMFDKDGKVDYQIKKIGTVTEYCDASGVVYKKEIDRGNGLNDTIRYCYDRHNGELEHIYTQLYNGRKIDEDLSLKSKKMIPRTQTVENSPIGKKFNLDYLHANFPKDKYDYDDKLFDDIIEDLTLVIKSKDGNEEVRFFRDVTGVAFARDNKLNNTHTHEFYNSEGNLCFRQESTLDGEQLLRFSHYNGVTDYTIELNADGSYTYLRYDAETNEMVPDLSERDAEDIILDFIAQDTDVQNTNSNGKIDRPFSQGHIGDCWLLASIKAIANTPNGLKRLNDSIKVLENGNIEVNLNGVNKSYIITAEELNSREDLSRGDKDVRAIEIAMEKYFKEANSDEITGGKKDLDGNYMIVAYKILLGNKEKIMEVDDILEKDIDNFNKENYIATVSAYHEGKKNLQFEAKSGFSTVKLFEGHAYSIVGSDKENVYFINPHKTSEILCMPRGEFIEFFNNLEIMDLR